MIHDVTMSYIIHDVTMRENGDRPSLFMSVHLPLTSPPSVLCLASFFSLLLLLPLVFRSFHLLQYNCSFPKRIGSMTRISVPFAIRSPLSSVLLLLQITFLIPLLFIHLDQSHFLLGIQSLDDWCRITADEFRAIGGGDLLSARHIFSLFIFRRSPHLSYLPPSSPFNKGVQPLPSFLLTACLSILRQCDFLGVPCQFSSLPLIISTNGSLGSSSESRMSPLFSTSLVFPFGKVPI